MSFPPPGFPMAELTPGPEKWTVFRVRVARSREMSGIHTEPLLPGTGSVGPGASHLDGVLSFPRC